MSELIVHSYFMQKYSSNKDIQKLVSNLIKDNWVYHRNKKHGSLRSPKGIRITIPGTPSDRRAYRNFLKDTQRKAWL